MNSSTTSILLAGVGGQGIVLAGSIVARAAMEAGFDVKVNEVHGMAQRGGSVVAQIRYGREIHSPLMRPGEARVLGAFEKIEALRYAHYLAADGLAVVSTTTIIPVTVSSGAARYPADAEARLRTVFPRLITFDASAEAVRHGDARMANVLLLGALSTGLDLAPEAWRAAIRATVKPAFVDVNLAAFETGRGIPAT
jgi:indolepyruvate ferredoxin oxidoreductase beta subunit